jgi:hypothetical protein
MYFAFVVFLMFVLPVVSTAVEALWFNGSHGLMFLVGKWFVFWTVGLRLLLAGIRQVAMPRFTAESIFEIKDPAANAVVREVGFANLAMGWDWRAWRNPLGWCRLRSSAVSITVWPARATRFAATGISTNRRRS